MRVGFSYLHEQNKYKGRVFVYCSVCTKKSSMSFILGTDLWCISSYSFLILLVLKLQWLVLQVRQETIWNSFFLNLWPDVECSSLKMWMHSYTDYGHTKAKSQILCGPNSNPTPKKKYLGVGYKGLVFFVEIMVE